MTKPQSSSAIANLIITIGNEINQPVTLNKLQKIMFFAQGYWLLKHQQELINASFTKYSDGPFCPFVWSYFKHHDRTPITELISTVDISTSPATIRYPMPALDPEQFDELRHAIMMINQKSAWDLYGTPDCPYDYRDFYNNDEIVRSFLNIWPLVN